MSYMNKMAIFALVSLAFIGLVPSASASCREAVRVLENGADACIGSEGVHIILVVDSAPNDYFGHYGAMCTGGLTGDCLVGVSDSGAFNVGLEYHTSTLTTCVRVNDLCVG